MLLKDNRDVFRAHVYRQGLEKERIIAIEGEELCAQLICFSCKRLVCKPSECESCAVLYCESCSIFALGRCAICNQDTRRDVKRETKQALCRIKVVCKNKEFGCTAVLFYENIEEHEENCLFERLLCIFHHCDARVERKSYPTHIQNCEYRLLVCVYCGISLQHKNLSSHIVNCELRFYVCPGCNKKVLNRFLAEHIDFCDQITV